MAHHRVRPGTRVRLGRIDPADTGKHADEAAVRAKLGQDTARLAKLQDVLYAERRHAVLVVLQGMDTSGKDGTVKHVMSGVNPSGCEVVPFKVPTEEEAAHDFLWRAHRAAPRRGHITIFHRPHYQGRLVPPGPRARVRDPRRSQVASQSRGRVAAGRRARGPGQPLPAARAVARPGAPPARGAGRGLTPWSTRPALCYCPPAYGDGTPEGLLRALPPGERGRAVLRPLRAARRALARGGGAPRRHAARGRRSRAAGRARQGRRAPGRRDHAHRDRAPAPDLHHAHRPGRHPRAHLAHGRRPRPDRGLGRAHRALRHPHHGARGARAGRRAGEGGRGDGGGGRHAARPEGSAAAARPLHRDQPPRERGRPAPAARGRPSLPREPRSNPRHQVEGDLRLPGECDRSLRGRRQRDRRRGARVRLIRGPALAHPHDRPLDPRRPRLRLHERLPRRGELDRHRRLDPRPHAARGGGVGGFLLGALFMLIIIRLVYRAAPATIDRAFRRLQLVSAAGYSLGHGTNDAQKTMGIIAVLLFTSGYLGEKFYVPFWVILICHAAIALGTMFGGWRIVRTMGMRLTALQPLGGFCAETAGAIALLGSATLGIPVSTTHTITGAIVGVGSTRRLSAVRWGVAQNVVLAWILTIPCTATLAALVYLPLRLLRA